jgi:hypothetical protein
LRARLIEIDQRTARDIRFRQEVSQAPQLTLWVRLSQVTGGSHLHGDAILPSTGVRPALHGGNTPTAGPKARPWCC